VLRATARAPAKGAQLPDRAAAPRAKAASK